MTRIILICLLLLGFFACNNNSSSTATTPATPAAPQALPEDPHEGHNHELSSDNTRRPKIKELSSEDVAKLAKPKVPIPEEAIEVKGVNFQPEINPTLFKYGSYLYEDKCIGCHSINGSDSQASSFKGLLDRRDAGWVITFITNYPKNMGKDAAENKKLQQCPTRTDKNKVSIKSAREFIEYARTF